MPETDFMDAGALAVRVAELTAALAERDSVIADFKLALSNRDADYAALLERVGDLERRLGLDSSNSGKPPSSDGLAKPNAPSRDNARRRSDRRPGGQKGHPGSTLARSGTPDRIEHHRPEVCPGCGGRLDPEDSEVHASRQVHDIPEPVPPQVIEHRVHRCRCRACGEVAVAGFPEGVNAPGPVRPECQGAVAVPQFGPVHPPPAAGGAAARPVRAQAVAGDGLGDHRARRRGVRAACRADPQIDCRGAGEAHGRDGHQGRGAPPLAARRLRAGLGPLPRRREPRRSDGGGDRGRRSRPLEVVFQDTGGDALHVPCPLSQGARGAGGIRRRGLGRAHGRAAPARDPRRQPRRRGDSDAPAPGRPRWAPIRRNRRRGRRPP